MNKVTRRYARCYVCGDSHPSPEPRSYEHEADEHAYEAAVADPKLAYEVWQRAADVMNAASTAVRSLEDVRTHLPVGSKSRDLVNAALYDARRAHCRAIVNLWELPHPSEIHSRITGEPIGCVRGPRVKA